MELAGVRFERTSFANAEIAESSDITGLRIAGVKVKDLFDAWKRLKS